MSNNGIGKFPVINKVTKIYGCSTTIVDTVYISEPSAIIANDSTVCCNTNTDTLRFYSKYLSKPYNEVSWFDDVTDTLILYNSEVLPASMLTTNSNMRIRLYIQDAKGCEATDVKQFNIGTGTNNIRNEISVSPNPVDEEFEF